jgi:hypothetical protein
MVFMAEVPSGPIVFQTPQFQLSVSGTGWVYSNTLAWSINTTTQYSVGIMFDNSATYYYTTNGGNTDGTLTSTATNGNFYSSGSFATAYFSCCAAANIYTSITYTTAPSGTVFTAGGTLYNTYRTSYYMPSLTFTANKNIVLSQVAQYVSFSGQAQAIVIIATTSNEMVVYQTQPFSVSGNSTGAFVSGPATSWSLTANTQYSVGLMFNTPVTYYYSGSPDSDSTISAASNNGNFQANTNFQNPSFDCCASAEMYVSLTYSAA